MAIEFFLNIQGEFLTPGILISEVNKLGVGTIPLVENTKNGFRIESHFNSLGFTVSVFKSTKPPYNIVDTAFLDEKEFEFNQNIYFRFNKELDFTPSFENAIKIIQGVMCNANTRALLNSSMRDDLCFFDYDKTLHINTLAEMWNNIDIAKELEKWNVKAHPVS